MISRVAKHGFLFTTFCILITGDLFSQAEYINLNLENNLRVEKNLFRDSDFHSNIRPYIKSNAFPNDSISESNEIAISNPFLYQLLNGNILEKKKNNFRIYANPILGISPQIGFNPGEFYNNFRAGLTFGGNISHKFAFHFDGFYGIREFSEIYLSGIDSSSTIPGVGPYLSKDGNAYNFISLTGYLSYTPFKFLNLQTGIGSHFWGDGYRSLFLSDNSAKYPFFKAAVNVWKIKYIWMFGYLKDFNSTSGSSGMKSKLQFSHYLSWNATKWLNINFFESIISNPVDSMGVTYFNINYLNPVIFFRPVEFSGGSADNALLGFGFKVKFFKKYHIYTQMVIDEFVWSEMKSGSGWWGNKFGLQAGMKSFDLFGVKNLFLQFEYNAVRPYTYSYSTSILNYGNHFQALAHPTGANFQELVLLAHYHKKRFSVLLKSVFSAAGMDADSVSYGQDIYKSYNLRQGDYNNAFLQGYKGKFWDVELKISWLVNPELNHSVFISFKKQKMTYPQYISSPAYISVGLIYNLWNEELDYLD